MFSQFTCLAFFSILITACSLLDVKTSPANTVIPTEIVTNPLPTSTVIPTEAVTHLSPAITTTATQASFISHRDSYYQLGDCVKEQCLFYKQQDPIYPVGTATLNGYYTRIEKFYYEGDSAECDSFVIIDGSQALISSFKNLVEIGNSINSINDSGQLIVSLDFENLVDKEKILETSQEHPVELFVLIPVPLGTEGATCHSPVEIIEVR